MTRKPKTGAETTALGLWKQAKPSHAGGLNAADSIEFVDRFTPDQWSQ